jgi:uncharacterized protein (TIGR03083 family)
MGTQMDKPTFMAALLAERAAWDNALAQVDPARLEAPGLIGQWTVKDVIAHLAWHEREMVTVIAKRALAGSPWWGLSFDERNAHIYAQHKDQPLADVLAEAKASYADFLAALEAVTDLDLNDPARWAEMPLDWEPWRVFSSNTYEHYRDHAADLRAAITQQP